MLKKVKQWLGIEGVKIELIVPELIPEQEGKVTGQVRFSTQHTQVVRNILFKVIEKYSRGKKEDLLVDEYILGTGIIDGPIEIPAQSTVEMNFSIPFDLEKSKMDQLEAKNIFYSGLVKVAKRLRNVKSEYRVEAQATIEGTALHPFHVKSFILKR